MLWGSRTLVSPQCEGFRQLMTSRFRWESIWLFLSFALTVTAAGWSMAGLVGERKPDVAVESLQCVVVQRGDFDTTLLAGGDLQPAKQATVTCQVEDVTDSDGTMVLSVIENGTPVKKEDELCRLDSSALEELARQEEILVTQARATYLKARLDLETAKIALLEYQEGLVTQWTKEYESRIALGRSDVKRQEDRLAWAEAMLAKGYLALGQLLSERQTLARVRHELKKTEGEFELFRRFQVLKEIHSLRGQIETAEIGSRLEADRLKAEEDELAYLRKQIENCIIRAPQDGVVVHANRNRWWSRPLEPGTRVYQEQAMFLIPDLTQMEVDVSVHESMGPRVRVGMKAKVRVASRADHVISGRVIAVNLLPTSNWKEWDESLKHFFVRVRLDEKPASALPFMSATVEIDTGRVSNALVIPVEAMAVVDGQQSCYVVADNGLERRAIKTRRATRDLLEITAGLQEGERVLSRSLDVDKLAVGGTTHHAAREVARIQSASPRMSEARATSTARSAPPPLSGSGNRSTS
jgi:HlyD family secretion protein